MASAFGFSTGDLISGIGLIVKVKNALQDTGGASTEYQQVIVHLRGLEKTLVRLQSLDPDAFDRPAVEEIRCMARGCMIPLQTFLTAVEKYKSSLVPNSTARHGRRDFHKIQWGLTMEKEVKKMRDAIAAQVSTLQLFLQAHALSVRIFSTGAGD